MYNLELDEEKILLNAIAFCTSDNGRCIITGVFSV
jgi:hypothetical protein